MKYMNDPKVYMAMEGMNRKASWTSELDEMNNAGAHAISEEFVKADGNSPYESANGYGPMEDKTVPGNRDISVDWNAVDSKLGAAVSFNSKADV